MIGSPSNIILLGLKSSPGSLLLIGFGIFNDVPRVLPLVNWKRKGFSITNWKRKGFSIINWKRK